MIHTRIITDKGRVQIHARSCHALYVLCCERSFPGGFCDAEKCKIEWENESLGARTHIHNGNKWHQLDFREANIINVKVFGGTLSAEVLEWYSCLFQNCRLIQHNGQKIRRSYMVPKDIALMKRFHNKTRGHNDVMRVHLQIE